MFALFVSFVDPSCSVVSLPFLAMYCITYDETTALWHFTLLETPEARIARIWQFFQHDNNMDVLVLWYDVKFLKKNCVCLQQIL